MLNSPHGKKFLSTLSLRRATSKAQPEQSENQTFLSTLSLRRATAETAKASNAFTFLSTLSLRRATNQCKHTIHPPKFLSTLSLRRATFNAIIHLSTPTNHFYPRSPCGERPYCQGLFVLQTYFYPRSPCGERPRSGAGCLICLLYFYPRSPCGERQRSPRSSVKWQFISIHALLAESDGAFVNCNCNFTQFLSTLSLRRATIVSSALLAIHTNFYPRSPCGERRR